MGKTDLARLHGDLQAKQIDLIRLQQESSQSTQELEALNQQLAARIDQASQVAGP